MDDLREVVLRKNDSTDALWPRSGAPTPWECAIANTRRGSPRERSAWPWSATRSARAGESTPRIDSNRSLKKPGTTARRSKSGGKVEILNCAVPGHAPGQRWHHFGLVGWSMEPDLVIYESTAADVGWDERRLRFLLARGLGWDSPIYKAVLEASGAHHFLSPDQYKRLLEPRHWEILSGVYRSMTADCRARGVPIFWVLVPRIGRRGDRDSKARLIETARSAGFSGVIDLTGAFDDLDPTALSVDRDDFHPNAVGHARLAQRLNMALESRARGGKNLGQNLRLEVRRAALPRRAKKRRALGSRGSSDELRSHPRSPQ